MRLIDADKLMENKFKNDISYNAFCNLVKRQPSIDAEQVVLCKDCKHSYTMMTARSKDGQERWTRFCDKHKTLFPKDDWFCKDGERKEE